MEVVGDREAHGAPFRLPGFGQFQAREAPAGYPLVNQDLHQDTVRPGAKPLRVIPVIDLRRGVAVHAVGGERALYRPVRSPLGPGDDPLRLAIAFRDVLGLEDLYVADLDAIEGGKAAFEFFRQAADSGLRLWVDAGLVDDGAGVDEILDAGVSHVIAATETLRGEASLRELARRTDRERLVFGLDLRGGVPVTGEGASWSAMEPEHLIETAVDAGFRRVLILDMARVGRGQGVGNLSLVARARGLYPRLEVCVGGGVAGRSDLDALKALGVSAAFVGSALLDGRIGKLDCSQVDSTSAD
ncbi:MAG: HisA/HisF family protein [Isosphaeraceae bacterium]